MRNTVMLTILLLGPACGSEEDLQGWGVGGKADQSPKASESLPEASDPWEIAREKVSAVVEESVKPGGEYAGCIIKEQSYSRISDPFYHSSTKSWVIMSTIDVQLCCGDECFREPFNYLIEPFHYERRRACQKALESIPTLSECSATLLNCSGGRIFFQHSISSYIQEIRANIQVCCSNEPCSTVEHGVDYVF